MKIDHQNIWFTADTHFGHTNIIEFCKRPWTTIKEHDEALIENWNATIPKGGIVFHIGDVAICRPGYLHSILQRLNGQIHLITGNHDRQNNIKKMKQYFSSMQPYLEIKVKRDNWWHRITLCHYWMGTWRERGPRGQGWMLHGHTHGEKPNFIDSYVAQNGKGIINPCQRCDVGVDVWSYEPVGYKQLWEYMKDKKDTKPI